MTEPLTAAVERIEYRLASGGPSHVNEWPEIAADLRLLLASHAGLQARVTALSQTDRAGLKERFAEALAAGGIAVEIGSREFYALESAFNGRVADAQRARATTAETALAQAREALEFYARTYSWRSSTVYACGHSGQSSAELDAGNKARAALAALRTPEQKEEADGPAV